MFLRINISFIFRRFRVLSVVKVVDEQNCMHGTFALSLIPRWWSAIFGDCCFVYKIILATEFFSKDE